MEAGARGPVRVLEWAQEAHTQYISGLGLMQVS